MDRIDVDQAGAHRYAVTVTGTGTGSFQVSVPDSLRDELGEPDEEDLVRESFRFLLAREPVGSIMSEFGLDVISRYFPEYVDAMRERFGS